MKNLEDSLKELLTIIKDAPAIRVGHFCDSNHKLIDILEEFANKKDNIEYILNITNKEFFEKIKDSKRAKFFNLNRANYMLQGKFFDYLFVTCNIDSSFRDEFLKRVHKVIKNGGLILIFVDSNDYKRVDSWNISLEENYFVATNKIDLNSNLGVIVSRKMHGWGG